MPQINRNPFNRPDPKDAFRLRSVVGDIVEGMVVVAIALAFGYALLFAFFPGDPADLKEDRLDLNTTVIQKNVLPELPK